MTTALNDPQPGDTSPCGICLAPAFYTYPLPERPGQPAEKSHWTHLRSIDPATSRPISYDHQAVPS